MTSQLFSRCLRATPRFSSGSSEFRTVTHTPVSHPSHTRFEHHSKRFFAHSSSGNMGKEDMFLFWGSGSSPCMRVMIALEEKGFSGYGQKRIDFTKKEHKGEDVLAVNPRGQLPAFKDGDIIVNESYAIIHYLQHRYANSGTNLLPGDDKQQALALQRYYEIQSNVSSGYSAIFRAMQYEKEAEDAVKKRVDGLLTQLANVDKYLAEAQFVAGDSFSLGDIELITVLTMCERQALPLKDRLPNLYAYYERNKVRPSVVASYPPHFKTSDSPKMLANF